MLGRTLPDVTLKTHVRDVVGEDDDPYGETRPEPVIKWLKANPPG